jgi:predicted peptidase
MTNFIRSALSPFVLLATLWICHANTPVDGFRERIFKNERGETMPYRLFVPSNYDAKKKYPIVLWLHGGGGRGNDNLKQISGGNLSGTRFWTSAEAQKKYPSFVLAPQCPDEQMWTTVEDASRLIS